MRRNRSSVFGALWALLLLVTPAAADDTDEALQAELDAILRELNADWGSEDVFVGGRKPDLLVVSTTDVRGEVGPCG